MNPPSRDGGGSDGLRGTTPSVDEALDILRHQLRRDLIECCESMSGRTTDLEALTEQLASHGAASRDGLNKEQLETTLHHRHLPKLSDYGVIDFDPRSGQLQYYSDDLIKELLARIQEVGPV